jgi:transposase
VSITAESGTLPEKYIPAKTRWRVMNPEYVALWGKYLDEGYAIKHVAEIFGVHTQTVRQYYPGRGWSSKQASAQGKTVRKLNTLSGMLT